MRVIDYWITLHFACNTQATAAAASIHNLQKQLTTVGIINYMVDLYSVQIIFQRNFSKIKISVKLT